MSDSGVWRDVIFLGMGLLGGYAISYYFHSKQKTDSADSHAELITSLDKIYEQALRNGVNHSNVIQSVKSIENEIVSLSDLVDIKEKMDESLSSLKSRKKGEELPLDNILRYKALGDKWSELVSARLDLQILADNGEIEKERLLAVHKTIFPEDFPWAGKYRNQHVYVVDDYGTTARIVDIVQAKSQVKTIDPDAIDKNLMELLGHWNRNIQALIHREPNVKLSEVANFHHEFELIHPFLDGNGRIGRMLLGEQLSLLFGSQVKFRPENQDYYRALRMMNMGETKPFIELIAAELRKFNVAR